jgi:7,8-dihydroneopterin aldolase/epimerase/oxygenase
MKHSIEVSGINIYAFHGCLEEEARIGGNYIVDVYLETDFTQAGLKDELSLTVDYVNVNKIVASEMAIRSNLIEHVGQRIWDKMTAELIGLNYLRIKIRKLMPPINGNVDEVAICIEGKP